MDRAHPLWRAHAKVEESAWISLTAIIREMEANCVKVRKRDYWIVSLERVFVSS